MVGFGQLTLANVYIVHLGGLFLEAVVICMLIRVKHIQMHGTIANLWVDIYKNLSFKIRSQFFIILNSKNSSVANFVDLY